VQDIMGVKVMKIFSLLIAAGLLVIVAGWIAGADAGKVDGKSVLTGQAAFADYRSIKPGQFHKITADDLAKPFETKSTANPPRLVAKPDNLWPQAPAGFKVELYVSGLGEPCLTDDLPGRGLLVRKGYPYW